MFYSRGRNEILHIINKMCGEHTGLDIADSKLKHQYNAFIGKISVFESLVTWEDVRIVDINGLRKISPSYCSEYKEHFKKNSSLLNERIKNGFFQKALYTLKEQNLEIYTLANFIIKAILVNQLTTYINGTTDKTIGLASMDFKDEFTEQD